MKSTWTKGKDKQGVEDTVEAFQNSAYLRKELIKILQDKIASKQLSAQNVSNYESPAWAFQMADTQGFIRALTEIIKLIEK